MDPSVLEKLRDIHGLDPLPWWHMAPGWPLLFGAVLLLFLTRKLWWPRKRSQSWRKDAEHQLRSLRRQLREQSPKHILDELSELLRRIAMARHGRHACAGLYGEEWLAWLQAHDPQGFAWESEGRELVEMRYAPPDSDVEKARIRRLVDAAQHWIRAEPPQPVQQVWWQVWKK